MTVQRKNYYEELIDKMMLEGITGLSDDRKEKIKKLPTKQKRLNILRLLEDNDIQHRKLFSSILHIVRESDISATEHIKDVVTKLREYIEVGAIEKKKFGEVMTPISLVEEMLDTLPNEVWSNPDLKWLDGANGVGIFPSVIIDRLMEGLSNIFPDEEERYKHIMEDMIYVCELQPKNLFLYLCAFDPEDKYELNIYNGSYLDNGFDEHMSEVYGVDQWNIITINPPYQEQKEGFKKTQPLWHKFVQKSIETSLKEGGYLVAVHPSGWRSIKGIFKNTQNLLKSKEMLYLEMHNTKDGFNTFGANTTYDFYCLRNKKNLNFLTKIKTFNGKIEYHNLINLEYIPDSNIKFVLSLIAKDDEEKVNVLYSRSAYGTDKLNMSKELTEEFKYPCAYTVGAKNPNFWYSNIKKEFFVPKVFWGNGLTDVRVDKDGKYGLTQFTYAIVDEEQNLYKVHAALKSEKFIKDVMGYTKGVGHIYDYKVIALFRKDFWKEFI